MITRNTGADLMPLHTQISYPGARLRALRQAARARREREAPPPDEAFDAERLRRDLASLSPDMRNGEEREHLRKMGWTGERLARAQSALREDLGRRVHPPTDLVVTAAGAGGSATRSRPSSPSSPTDADRSRIIHHMKAAWAAGYDPYALRPSLRRLRP